MIAGDSCGTGNTSKVIAGTGMDAYLERYGVPAVDFSAGVKGALSGRRYRRRNLSLPERRRKAAA